MNTFNRRQFLAGAASLGVVLAFPCPAVASRLRPVRDDAAFPQGVASADPEPDGFIVWARRPPLDGAAAHQLWAEVSEEADFNSVVAKAHCAPAAEADWTCRVMVHGLQPDRAYWYRFVDDTGRASRTGRTFTAPPPDSAAAARFAFMSCQNINMGYCTAYRQLLKDDAALAPAEKIRFVLHLGDFIYEMVFRPQDHPDGMQGRALREVAMPTSRKVGGFHVPASVEDYRALYRAYLSDPDLQDARAQWPFVCVWDNHEFSHGGWQSQQVVGESAPAQSLKVAANQAWFEYMPARVAQGGGACRLERFEAPQVSDAVFTDFDAGGLSHEPNNLAAINSLTIYRGLRWGRNVELLLTDNRSFRAQPVMYSEAAAAFKGRSRVPWFTPQDLVHVLDAGRTAADDNPSEAIAFAGERVPNPSRDASPPSMLGAVQKQWFIDRLQGSAAVWKLWGNSVGMLDRRTDLQHLPGELAQGWPFAGYGMLGPDDWSGYASERAELLAAITAAGVTNFASLAGDRHAFFAGVVSPALPPEPMEPVGVEFIVGSLGTPTLVEAAASALPLDHPCRGLFLTGAADGAARPALNVALRHGVRSALALSDQDASAAKALRNPGVAPHLAFADMDGHGYAIVRADADALEVEFVGLPAPVSADDPQTLYRVSHRVSTWQPGQAPVLQRSAESGAAALAERFLDTGWS